LVSRWAREDKETRARVESECVRYEEEIYDLEILLAPAQLLGGQDSENHGVWKTVTAGRRFGKEVQGSPKQLRSTMTGYVNDSDEKTYLFSFKMNHTQLEHMRESITETGPRVLRRLKTGFGEVQVCSSF
jgi:hypothetical protein